MKITSWQFIGALILVKLPLLLTNHIQEDAFITWRVAKNLVDYGVMGFNGEVPLSASTTYLYTLFSACFAKIIGGYDFFWAIIVANIIIFTTASWYFTRLIFTNRQKQIGLFIFLNLLPPSFKASYMGMEYALLFGLFTLFLWNGKHWKSNLWYAILPVLIIWTRLDAAIFLGLYFLFDWYYSKKINFSLVAGGALAIVSFVGFNYFYFGEFVNHTIIAKKIAYQDSESSLYAAFFHFFFYSSWIKNYTWFIVIPVIFPVIAGIFYIIKTKNYLLRFLLVFALIKIFLFTVVFKAHFDWYFWIPQIILGIALFKIIIQIFRKERVQLIALSVIGILLISYTAIHSIATGHGEWDYRAQIGKHLDAIEPDKSQYILLEPAGYIPYFSKLKVMDEVGLVNADVTEEMINDFENWYPNTIAKYKPKYILALSTLDKDNIYNLSSAQSEAILSKYKLYKAYKIEDNLKSSNRLVEYIYKLKPSGRDYYLYIRE